MIRTGTVAGIVFVIAPVGLEADIRGLVMLRGITGDDRTSIRLVADFGIILGSRASMLVLGRVQLAPVILIDRLRPMGRHGIIGLGRCGHIAVALGFRLMSRLFFRAGEIGADLFMGNGSVSRRHMNGFRRVVKLFRLALRVTLLVMWGSGGNGRFVERLLLAGRLFVNRLRLCGDNRGRLFLDRLVPFFLPLAGMVRLGGMGCGFVGNILSIIGCCRLFSRRRESVVFLQRRKRLGIFAVHFGNGGVQLGDLPAQQFFRRTWLHILELAHNRTARLVVNLRPVFGSIVRQAIHGLANDCYKIRHKHFLVVTGDVPARYGL